MVSTLGYLFLFLAWRPLVGPIGANAVAMAIAQDNRYSGIDATLVIIGRCARCAGLARDGIGLS